MDLEQRLDAAVKRAIAENRIVGAVLIVRQNGELVYETAQGLADREAGRPMTADAIFRLSSLTKPIVATTILALLDAGQLRLDDKVTRYLPYFRPRMTNGSAPDITIHHLLTHTSGLSSASIVSAEEEAAGVNRWRLGSEEIVCRLATLPLLFAPGTGWSYGPSIDVLGEISAKLVGGKPEDAIRQYVTDPLGMNDSRFGVTNPSRLAAAYADGTDGPELMGNPHSIRNPWGGITTYDPDRIFDALAFQSGGGGMAGTASDFITLLETLRTGGGAILKPETVARGMADQTPQLAQAQGPGWKFGYFGAWLDDPQAAQSPAPRGLVRWGGIYGHNWFIDPVNGLTVLSMTNTGLEGSDGAYREEIRNAVYGVAG
ncbi:beta-lactamase family protein [Devosia oryziradicis]|uniref:Beta-lactamase family protein n=1 Tax=Devosia oryziradicis TaxID=2801335 RepID=A0ABX7BTK4_9HYPH|nr:serine hydrolase domain-containing protein [Devosia oryziradicis]QQR35253.1 beta-lactamase family protein [Devosia oryziradicis]